MLSTRTIRPLRLFPSFAGPSIPAEVTRSMQYAVGEGALSGIITSFQNSVLLTGLALALGADDLLIGLLASLFAGANLLQMPAYRMLERHGNRKRMAIRCALLSRLLWLPILTVILLPEGWVGAERRWLFVLLYALALSFGAFSFLPWTSWLVDLVPPEMRGRFFATRTLAMGLPGVALALLAGRFVDLWNLHGWGPAPHAFVVPFGCAVLAGLFAIRSMRAMTEPPFIRPRGALSFWASFRAPFADRRFRKLFAFRASFDLSMGIAGTFFGLYLLQQARLSFTLVTVLVMLSTLLNYLSLPFWGRLIDRAGNKPVLRICLIGKIVFTGLWLFTSPETIWLYVVIHLFGVFDGGNAVAIPTLIYKIAPAERRANYLSVDGTAVGVATTIAPLLGGALATLFSGWTLTLGGLGWTHFHLLFLVATLLRIVTYWFLDRVEEPSLTSGASQAAPAASPEEGPAGHA